MGNERTFGLIGAQLQHSFSQDYFRRKFKQESIDDADYKNFELGVIDEFTQLILENYCIRGLNVTIPYKEQIIPFLDELEPDAAVIGAVNTIQFKDGLLKGFNTDHIGFRDSLKPLLLDHHKKALVLGTGGSSKAVRFALAELGIEISGVSRDPKEGDLSYLQLTSEIISNHKLIINTTPLGMYPAINDAPEIPYDSIGRKHLLYDLIYNPEETVFLRKGKERGAEVKNGEEMLILQAEAAWDIWN